MLVKDRHLTYRGQSVTETTDFNTEKKSISKNTIDFIFFKGTNIRVTIF